MKELLGHANIKTTDTCLNVTKTGMHESMRRFDESVLRCNPVATKGAIDPRFLATRIHRPSLMCWSIEGWCGGRGWVRTIDPPRVKRVLYH